MKELKKIYLELAETVPNYKQISQVELAEEYLQGGPKAEACLAALIVRYWNIIEKQIYKDYGLYDEKEAYDWFINSLLYTLEQKPWQDKNSSLYNDPKAIERALNTCVKCDRANWFQASNRYKRMINHNTSSLEALSEEYKDSYIPDTMIRDNTADNDYKFLVCEYYNKQQYLLSLIIDVIVHDVPLDKCEDTKSLVLNIKRCIKSLPNNYYKIFAELYEYPVEQVEKSFSYIYNMSDSKLKQSIENYIYMLMNKLKKR